MFAKRASAQRSTPSGNVDTVAEGEKLAARQTVAVWRKGTERQAVPEWKTDFWKHRVEGEARKHFDEEIVGAGRVGRHVG